MSVDPSISILLVEDSDIMRKMEAKILRDLGFSNILEAVDGKAAVSVLETDQAVDLIISDWNMPNMDGLELLVWVRSRAGREDTAFLMATAKGEKKQVATADEAGVSGLVSKPFTPDELRVKIDEAMGPRKEKKTTKLAARQPQFTPDGRLLLNMAHIQITDHLILGVLKHQIETGMLEPEHFALATHRMPSWNPVQAALEEATVDGALVLAPIAMDLFGFGVPIRLMLLAHKNGSIFVRNRMGNYGGNNTEFFKNKSFYIPHRLSVHHMLAHRFMVDNGLTPGVAGQGGGNVAFEVVPPIKMPEFLAGNRDCAGFMVAEPLGTKAIAAGTAELQFLSGEVWEDHPCCVVTLRKEIIDQHPKAVQEFVGALVKAGQFVAREPAAAAEIAVGFLDPDKSLGLNKAVLKNVLTEPSGITTHDLLPVKADLARMQDYMCGVMGVGSPVDLDEFVDNRFAEKACRQTGELAVARKKAGREGEGAASDRAAKAMLAKEGKYLTFMLDKEEYGIGIMKIKEIIGIMPVTAFPQMPEFVKGVINLRGRIIPVIDLRLRLGLEEIEYTQQTCIIVVEVPGRGGLVQTGIVTDSVSEVINVAAGDIVEPPAFGAGIDTRYILGMAKIHKGVKILLDIDRLLNEDLAA